MRIRGGMVSLNVACVRQAYTVRGRVGECKQERRGQSAGSRVGQESQHP